MVRSRSWTAMTMWSSGRVMAGVLSARCSGCQARGGAGVGVAHFGADVLRIAQQVEDGAGALHGLEQRIDLGAAGGRVDVHGVRSEEHTSELQSPWNLVCRLLLGKKKN